ncbi:MAG: alpha/beta fold hydrolase [Deltaproteobacteria bacterium]|nr:alpha/beta fold hydrolase [Deltaproteobacteria bacterium]
MGCLESSHGAVCYTLGMLASRAWPIVILSVVCCACTVRIAERDVFPDHRLRPVSDAVVRRNVQVEMPDGTRLRGWRLTPPSPRYHLVYFYGQGSSVHADAHKLFWLAEVLDLDILAVDYPGYGFSDGTATGESLRAASLAIFDAMAGMLEDDRQPIAVYGHSMGSGFAVWAASQRSRAVVVLEAPFTTVEAMFKNYFERQVPWYVRCFVGIKLAEPLRHPRQPIDLIAEMNAPLLVIHGDRDETIPIEFGRRMFEASASYDKHWCPISGAGHSPIWPERERNDKLGCLLTFLQLYAAARPEPSVP